MILSRIILVLGAGIVAIAVGWIFQSQNKSAEIRTELEIPVDIDYYLSRVTYRVMAKSGELDYELRSPYLQHFKRDDISRIDTPAIDIYRNNQHWQVEARTAEILHQQNILYFIDDVLMQRQGEEPMQLRTKLLRFESDNDLVIGEQGVTLTGKNTKIDADKAVFDLDKNVYSLTNTKAVYYHEKS